MNPQDGGSVTAAFGMLAFLLAGIGLCGVFSWLAGVYDRLRSRRLWREFDRVESKHRHPARVLYRDSEW